MNEEASLPPLTPEESELLEASGRELIAAFSPARAQPLEKTWEPDKPVVVAFDESNITGPIWTATLDPRTDRIVARAVAGKGRRLELDEEGCAKFDVLAERWACLAAAQTGTIMPIRRLWIPLKTQSLWPSGRLELTGKRSEVAEHRLRTPMITRRRLPREIER